MKGNHFLRIALPTPLRKLFDYLPPTDCNIESLLPGSRILVPLQKRILVGILIEITDHTETPLPKLKKALAILDVNPLIQKDIWELCRWASDYYHHSLGEVFENALPTLLRKEKTKWEALFPLLPQKGIEVKVSPAIELNQSQKDAVNAINEAHTFQVFLLDGITGSGKTEVYLQVIEKTLKQQKQILVLVPEIGLTPQTVERFSERFSTNVIALHSKLSEKKRLQIWLSAKENRTKIIIGTRSAIFTPFSDLGLIIVDEEHDLSFKQQEGFRYHARDLAIMRAHFNKIPIVLGTATPSLESFYKAVTSRYQHLLLPQRAGQASMPEIQIVDICKIPLDQGLSEPLLKEMKVHLEANNQVLLFLNRRGFSPVLMCHRCGWIAICKRCDKRMTYHQKANRLHCHHCDTQKKYLSKCAACGEKELFALGVGTERLEEVLTHYFPGVSIARIDRDTVQKKGAFESLLEKIQRGEHQILIGTQMIAKGHHFPNVTLVAIVDADGGFFSSDFRSVERMGQLILQVAGRSGRAEKPGKVLIQTHHPNHPLLQILLRDNYHQFAHTLLKERELAQLPPYQFFALFRAEAYFATEAMHFLNQLKIDNFQSNIQILGPISSPLAKKGGRHRFQLLIQSKKRSFLQLFLKKSILRIEKMSKKHRVRWSLDVDPLEMV